jgi:hypothetical protein
VTDNPSTAMGLLCIICGEPFVSRWRSRQITCGSKDCQRARETQQTRNYKNSLKTPIEKKRCSYAACGREFTPRSRLARIKYCSRACAKEANATVRHSRAQSLVRPKRCALPECGLEFTPAKASRRLIYCCRAHCVRAIRRRYKELRLSQRKWPETCAQCGNKLTPKTPWQNFCSAHCRYIHNRSKLELQRAMRTLKKYGEQLGLRPARKKPELERRPGQIVSQVDAIIPRFEKLIAFRRKTTKELIALGLSSNEIEALRMPGSRTATVAARYFISLESGLPYDTVAQYHKPSRRTAPALT